MRAESSASARERAPVTRRLAWALALAVAACGSRVAEAPAGAPRVISLAPSATRILAALGASGTVVGLDEVSHRIPGFERVPSLGGLFSPDLERTIELEPSVVLAARSAQQRAYLDELRRRGIHVEELSGHGFEEVLSSFAQVGRLVGREEEGQALAVRVRADLAAIARVSSALPRRSVALVIERDPLYVVGGGSFASELIVAAGGENVFADVESAYPRVSLEALADRAPELVIDASAAGADTHDAVRAAREHWRRYAWIRRVEALPADVATLPGPDLADGARALLALLHPDAVGEAGR